VAVLCFLALGTVSAHAGAANTSFNRATHGFRFINDFTNNFISELNIRTKGLCGGMSYAALDHYLANKPIPTQMYRPAVNAPLHGYIYNRQVASLESNVDKWAELLINPGGIRNGEFFSWGLVGRLIELRQKIDAGIPVPLGLKSVQGDFGSDHQVLAIGYDMGAYAGDGGANAAQLRIFVYDPNTLDGPRVLRPNMQGQYYYWEDNPSIQWRTYFVDTRYTPVVPPNFPAPLPVTADGQVRELLLMIKTGADDLRGGNDNVDATLDLRTLPARTWLRINGGARWIDNYEQTVSLVLPAPVRLDDVARLTLTTPFGGGIGGDNWNVNGIKLYAIVNGQDVSLISQEGNPLVRFTGTTHTYTAAVPGTAVHGAQPAEPAVTCPPLVLGQFEGAGYRPLPAGATNQAYTAQVFSGGHQARVTALAGLPSNAGLTFDNTGRITGTPGPSLAGQHRISFQVTDGCPTNAVTKAGSATLQIADTVAPQLGPVSLSPVSLSGRGGQVALSVRATDNAGIARVMVTQVWPDGRETNGVLPRVAGTPTSGDWRISWTIGGNTSDPPMVAGTRPDEGAGRRPGESAAAAPPAGRRMGALAVYAPAG